MPSRLDMQRLYSVLEIYMTMVCYKDWLDSAEIIWLYDASICKMDADFFIVELISKRKSSSSVDQCTSLILRLINSCNSRSKWCKETQIFIDSVKSTNLCKLRCISLLLLSRNQQLTTCNVVILQKFSWDESRIRSTPQGRYCFTSKSRELHSLSLSRASCV